MNSDMKMGGEMMNQKVIASSYTDCFEEKCDKLLKRGYTVVPGSVVVAAAGVDAGGRAVLVAFFDPPVQTRTGTSSVQ